MKQHRAISGSLYSQDPHSSMPLGETRRGGTPSVAHCTLTFASPLCIETLSVLRNVELLSALLLGDLRSSMPLDHPNLFYTLFTINHKQLITPQLLEQQCKVWSTVLHVLQEF